MTGATSSAFDATGGVELPVIGGAAIPTLQWPGLLFLALLFAAARLYLRREAR